jgi:hypothetical protein
MLLVRAMSLGGQRLVLSRASWTCVARPFHASSRHLDFHFDTHHFVRRLEREGLNRAQAEGIMSALEEVIDESIRNMTASMVTQADQEKVSWTILFRMRCVHVGNSNNTRSKWTLLRSNQNYS